MGQLKDPNTFSNINQLATEHVGLKLEVDFESKILKGSVVLRLAVKDPLVKELILDTDYLIIHGIFCNSEPKQSLEYKLLPRDHNFGSALRIDLREVELKVWIEIKIDYQTTKAGGAIQFLEPNQTLGKTYPYLFSQCQAIYARSMVPCQDTPSLKFTYTAIITVPKTLTAMMSAISLRSQEVGELKTFEFEQRNAIPSYLIALAVGNLASKALSDRTAVWCEPEMLDAAAFEFSDTERFLEIAEALTCPYQWGRYDLLVLPPSFPYGGMENPCLSFVTPTLLAGDKSAVDVIAHELAHSWTGNLVTNSNWENFWLNEGWTVFLERKIMGRMHGEAMRQFSSIIGWKELKQSVELFGADNNLTALCPKLENVNPDDAFSSVPYEKGFNLLYHLEQLVGGPEVFEPYMKAHIHHFAHKSISTEDWKSFLYTYMEQQHGAEKVKLLDSVEWERWLYAPGMPPVECHFDTSLSKACEELAKRWQQARNSSDFSSFDPSAYETLSAGQKVVFLDRLAECDPLPPKLLQAMAERYTVSTTNNCEVKLRWQLLCLKAGYEPIYLAVVDFLKAQGRMKYVRPLYRALNQAPNGAELAKATFCENRAFYHPIAAKLIEKDLFGKESTNTGTKI